MYAASPHHHYPCMSTSGQIHIYQVIGNKIQKGSCPYLPVACNDGYMAWLNRQRAETIDRTETAQQNTPQ